MPPSTDITRAEIERDTARIDYCRAQVELAAKLCAVASGILAFATTVVGATTVIIVAFLT